VSQGGTYVHDEDTGFVQFLNNFLRRYTDSADEQLGLLLDDYIDKFIEFTLGVIVVCLSSVSAERRDEKVNSECYLSAEHL